MNCILCKEDSRKSTTKVCDRCYNLWRTVEMNMDLTKEVIERIERREAVKEIKCKNKKVYIDNGFDQYWLCSINQKECLITGYCIEIHLQEKISSYKNAIECNGR